MEEIELDVVKIFSFSCFCGPSRAWQSGGDKKMTQACKDMIRSLFQQTTNKTWGSELMEKEESH
jgi:hypothetical protein